MSLVAILRFTSTNSNEHKLVDCKFKFSKHYNIRTHRPDSIAKCGVVGLTIIPLPEDFTFHEWYINKEVLSGSITFDLPLSDNEKKILTFENAFCISFSENYNIADKQQRVLKIEFVAKKMDVIIKT